MIKGFVTKWKSWMRGYMSSTNFSLLVNRNAERMLYNNQRYKARGPSSPFFSMEMGVLIRMFIRLKENNILEGFLVGRNKTRVSYL